MTFRLWLESYGEEGFIDSILDALPDTTPYLIYADWLEERGDPLGGYIRAFFGRMDRKTGKRPLSKELTRLKSQVMQPIGGYDPKKVYWSNDHHGTWLGCEIGSPQARNGLAQARRPSWLRYWPRGGMVVVGSQHQRVTIPPKTWTVDEPFDPGEYGPTGHANRPFGQWGRPFDANLVPFDLRKAMVIGVLQQIQQRGYNILGGRRIRWQSFWDAEKEGEGGIRPNDPDDLQRRWRQGPFMLELGYAGQEDNGRSIYYYRLYYRNKLIFEGRDFVTGIVGENQRIAELLSMLAEPDDSMTPEQLDFIAQHGEDLQGYASELMETPDED